MFDVQVKRIHEYKRQLLNILRVIIQYHRLLAKPKAGTVSRTVIFAGKAAPSYVKAKLIIKLITAVADKVNRDPAMRGRLRVVFLANYGVSLAEKIIPAADLSEQISTAGTEASGTGNMKLSLNGALTIGTLDGANIEIRAEVGAENFFLFGMTAEEAQQQQRQPQRTPYDVYLRNSEVRAALNDLRDGGFSPGEPGMFNLLIDSLLDPGDPFLALLDLEDYLRCQAEVDHAFQDTAGWTRKSILNVARMGKFSSDRSIREYARDIWGIPVP
jgi:starch phosphorylase